MKKWYCEVCGEIMEEQEITACTHCGLDQGFLRGFSFNTSSIHDTSRILIIGNGSAGNSVAKTLRKLHSTCSIEIFTKNKLATLHDMNIKQWDNTSSENLKWYEKHHIQLHQEEITHIDTKKQKIHSQAHCYPYDILVLAMGCERILPTIPGNDLHQIYTLDTFYAEQAKVVKANRRCVLIGSDFASIELACALADAHIQVAMIEPLPHVLPHELNTIGSEILSTYLHSQKIQLYTNRDIKEFHGMARVESIEFDDGKCINTDFVVCMGSLKPNTSLVKNTLINTDKRILINQHMQTNIEHIYACGEVAQSTHLYDNNYLHARQQGMLTAFHILGIAPPFQPHRSPRYVKHDNFSICLLGDIHHYDQHIEIFDEPRQTYEKYCYNEHKCSGVLLMNNDKHIEDAIKHFNEKSDFYPYRKKVS